MSTHDLLGVGIGPFNLGMAALATTVPGLDVRFVDQRPEFDWHPGMIIEGTTLQVSFLADLITPVDPCSEFTFLSYVKRMGRLYQFAIRDSHFVSRREYNQYCRWACERIPTLEFGTSVERIDYDAAAKEYVVALRSSARDDVRTCRARNVVIGVGTLPWMPACVPRDPTRGVVHSAEYMRHKQDLLELDSVTVVGSGQSAAEIFYDLLSCKRDTTTLTWLTRSERFVPMEYGKLTLEMASPDYIDHFFGLPARKRDAVLSRQDVLYKGINLTLIDRIYDALYDRTVEQARDDVRIASNCELRALHREHDVCRLQIFHRELEREFEYTTSAVLLATGYEYRIPEFLRPLYDRIEWDEQGRFVIHRDYSLAAQMDGLFVQNAEMHTHGFTASDLSVGPYRNATILNRILGYEHFSLERRVAFQDFGELRPCSARTTHGERVAGCTASPGVRPPTRERDDIIRDDIVRDDIVRDDIIRDDIIRDDIVRDELLDA